MVWLINHPCWSIFGSFLVIISCWMFCFFSLFNINFGCTVSIGWWWNYFLPFWMLDALMNDLSFFSYCGWPRNYNECSLHFFWMAWDVDLLYVLPSLLLGRLVMWYTLFSHWWMTVSLSSSIVLYGNANTADLHYVEEIICLMIFFFYVPFTNQAQKLGFSF